jgi:filamentous hemagglutinin
MAAGKLNELSGAIASSNPTGNEGMNEALGNIVANAVATAAGGAVGGNAGAFSGYDVDRYNRQLHPQEKTLAKQLAEKAKADGLKNPDGSSITAAQIEDQMRIMGGSFDASRESGSAVTLIGEMPTDSGARWLAAPETSDGKPVLTQITAQPNLGLQNYIATNAGSVSAGDVPSIVYDPTAKGGGVNVTGPFAKLDKSDVDYVRETTANVAGFAGTQFDRTSAMATALASAGLPFPFVSTSAEAIAVSASFVSWAAGGIQQLAKPDAGNYAVANLISQMTGKAMGTYPFAAPVINEVGNLISNSGVAQSAQDWVNSKWPTSNKK